MLQRNEKEILQAHLISRCKHKVSITCDGKVPKDKRKTWNILFCWITIMSTTSGTQQLMIWKPKFLPAAKRKFKKKEKKKKKTKKEKGITEKTGERVTHDNSTKTILSYKNSKRSDTFPKSSGLHFTVYLINEIPLQTIFLPHRQNPLLGELTPTLRKYHHTMWALPLDCNTFFKGLCIQQQLHWNDKV